MKKAYIVLVCILIAFTTFSQTPALLKDIYPGITRSNTDYLIKVGNLVFFQADDGVHGKELWKTDGTVSGTILVKDINPGASGSDPLGFFKNRANINGTLYFNADDGINGNALWKSDGTAAGTVLVKVMKMSGAVKFGDAANDLFYFAGSVTGDVMGTELWKSDGTAAGTVLIKDINPINIMFNDGSYPSFLVYMNGEMFFMATDGIHGGELWKSDGTDAGTVMVKDIKPGLAFGISVTELINFNNTLYFAADDGIHGTELWTSDGTEAGTFMIKDIKAGDSTSSSSPYGLKAVGNTLYFSVTGIAQGAALWKSDGTAAGTVLVKEINTSANTGLGLSSFNFTQVNNDIFFAAVDASLNSLLWKTDGTAAGTMSIKSWPGQAFQSSSNLTAFDGMLYFTAPISPATFGNELWKSDGTAIGTVLSMDIYPGSQGSYPGRLTELNGQLLFVAEDPTFGRELWILPNRPLPLTLLSFTVHQVQNKTELNWQTSSEVNTAIFEIERSAIASFAKIGSVTAMNQPGLQHYKFYDTAPLSGANFYRLKMIDTDGSFSYSSIVRVDYNTIEQVKLSPNPATNELKINNAGAYNLLQVIDVTGRVVQQQKIADVQVRVNIQKLVPGNYVLQLTGNSAQKSLQFVKK